MASYSTLESASRSSFSTGLPSPSRLGGPIPRPSPSRLEKAVARSSEITRVPEYLGIGGSLRSVMLSDFRKEPSPIGRGGRMLEETFSAYSLLGYLIENK